ncbi:MAG: DUF2723 domain-containing protein, partial [Elusimicrobiota bacterium]
TMPPTLAPYRDAGEMGVSTYSLGISHPPGYPVYVLAGHAAAGLLPFGTHAWRLNVLSALCGAGALAALFLILEPAAGAFGALACVLVLTFDSTFWNVCGVQEMYSLTLLFAVLLLGLALRLRAGFSPPTWLCFCLAYGLFLGNRTDLLLWAPGLLWLSLSRGALRRGAWPREAPWSWLGLSCAFGFLGLCVYLYLPFRSMRGPWLDWNHPATLANFIGSLTRRGYGGTLDLLSKSYASGTMFLPNLEIYARHLWANFGLPGLALAAVGVWSGWRSERSRLGGEGLLFLAAGPVFFYLANMPPNPHALAIVEPHYLLADLILALWAGMGAAALGRARWAAAAAVLVLAVQPWLLGRWAQMDRRWNLMDLDYVGNVLRSAPPGAAVIAKKDVQLFSLWHFLRVEGRRPGPSTGWFKVK